MEFRQLEIFVAVVDAGSLTAAAARCHLSQPAVTQQIHALEENVGEPLLVRRPRGVELTSAGAELAGHARRLLAERDSLMSVLAYADDVLADSGATLLTVRTALAVTVSRAREYQSAVDSLQGYTRELIAAHALERLATTPPSRTR